MQCARQKCKLCQLINRKLRRPAPNPLPRKAVRRG